MAENAIPVSIPELEVAAGKANAGLLQYKDEIGLVHNTSEKVVTELTDLIMAEGGYEGGKTELVNRNNVLRSLAASARAHAILVRDTLKPYLGKKYNQNWDPTGFRGSLRTPESPAKLQPLMLKFKGYFTANPDRQVEGLNITAARSGSLYDDMFAADGRITVQKTVVDGLLEVRDQKAAILRRRLRLLLNELEMTLDPMDSRWLAFGFNKPGAEKTPARPKGLHVVLNGSTATLTWAGAARAQHYRVWKKVVGVDTEPVAVGSPTDLLFVVNDLPLNATVEFMVSAVNSGGETMRSKAVSVVVK